MSIFRDDVQGNPHQCTKPKMRKAVYDLGVLAVIVVASCGYAVYLAFVSDKAHNFWAFFAPHLGQL